MKHNYEERRQKRLDNAKRLAEKNKQESDALWEAGSKMASAIPLGQPILVGHHSENRDRNYREKINNTFDRSLDAQKKAAYYDQKAEAIASNTAIFSDDPEALEKLWQRLSELEKLQEFMKAANKCLRKHDKEGFLKLPHTTAAHWEELNKPDCYGQTGFAGYKLSNNNATISRIKKRIAQLEKTASRTTSEITVKDVRLVENTEANRVQLFFTGKPSEEIRKQLKGNGFRWSPSEGAWQRHLTPQAVYVATTLLNNL